MLRQKRMNRRYIRIWMVWILGLSFIFSGCGKENAKSEIVESEENNIKLETFIWKLKGETKLALAVMLDETESLNMPSNNEMQPGKQTLYNLLLTAKAPLGHTMYVWGGGWNEEDTAAGEEAAEPQEGIGLTVHDGLDCSGYVGWVVYNVFEKIDGNPGYVEKATGMAESFASNGWGTYIPSYHVTDWKPGDVMSMKGHVWISLGMCQDGSVVLLHASPPGVILSGTRLKGGGKSQAIKLAEYYMQTYYPDWYERYPDCAKENSYLTRSGQMRWNRETLADEEGIGEMTAEEVLELLFLAESLD